MRWRGFMILLKKLEITYQKLGPPPARLLSSRSRIKRASSCFIDRRCSTSLQKLFVVPPFTRFLLDPFPSKKKAFYHRCQSCMDIEKGLNSARDVVTIAKCKRKFAHHILHMMSERSIYARTRLAAASSTLEQMHDEYADSILSIIIDGMDQSKTKLPLVRERQSEASLSKARLQVHLVGLLNHHEAANSHGYQVILQLVTSLRVMPTSISN